MEIDREQDSAVYKLDGKCEQRKVKLQEEVVDMKEEKYNFNRIDWE